MRQRYVRCDRLVEDKGQKVESQSRESEEKRREGERDRGLK